jgi:DTW domain-containing protein YfiP
VPVPTCETCHRPSAACVCDRIVTYATERRVLIVQHPQEQDALLGSAQILAASLPKVKVVVGLSWKNFAQALGEEDADPRRWAVLFPDPGAAPNTVTHRGKVLPPASMEGIVVLDGTWSKAKTLWWRNAWLLKLNRLTLAPKEPSIYGKLRLEPRKEFVSTLESVAAALTLCGEDPAIEAGLKRTFRTLVQRVRDARLVPPARPRPSKKRRPLPAERRRERAARATEPNDE